MTRIIATKVVPRASALGSNGAFYVDKGVRFTLTRLLAQGSAYKDLGRNGQERAITPKAAYTPVSKRPCSRSLSITRSPAQKSACKDLERNGQARAITSEATYTPTSNRAGSCSPFYLLGFYRDVRLNMYFLNGRGCMVSGLSSTCTKQKYTILSCVNRRKEECSHGTRHS